MRRSFWTLSLFLSLLVLGTPLMPAAAQITISEARQDGDGATVIVEGVVTRAFGSYVRFQDDSGPTGASALVVRQTSGAFNNDIQDGTITQGTQLRVEGTLSTFNGLLQINGDDLVSYTVQGQTTVPAPQPVLLADLSTNGEDYESELVTIADLNLADDVQSFGSNQTYEVTESGSSTTFDLRVQGSDESNVGGTLVPPTSFTYTGVVGQFDRNNSTTTGYQLIPVLRSDIQGGVFFSFAPAYNVSLEADGTVSATVRVRNVPDGESVTVRVAPAGTGTADPGSDLSNGISPTTLTFTGSDAGPQTVSLTLADDGTTEGVEYLVLELTSNDGPSVNCFTQWILDDATAQASVADGLEGSDLTSSLTQTYGNPSTLGYDVARDTMYRVIYNEGGVVEGFYSGYQVNVDPNSGEDASNQALDGGINTEHIFPQSLGAGDEPARSNMHILVPAREQVNTARSNFPFGEVPDEEADTWYFEAQTQSQPPTTNLEAWSELATYSDRTLNRFEPRHAVKGDVARAIFYFVIAYPNRADLGFFRTQRSTLLQWHADDPVDAVEMTRNVLQASYQANKLNPFVLDPTLATRAFDVLAAPADIDAVPGNDTVQLRWTEPLSSGAAGYNVYRSTSPFDVAGEAQLLNTGGPVTGTSFTDADVQLGGSYVYRITSVDANGNESDLSAAADALFYPNAFRVALDQSFGDVAETTSYRLVALPGDVDAPVEDNLGDPETGWTALWDDGSDSDFLVRFDGSDTFRFRPGRGFWLLSESNWTVNTSLPSVPLTNESVTIPLHDGWNIISNPLPVDLAWADVSTANGGALQPLWAWDGAFQETSGFTTGREGEAFYFLNNDGRTGLTLPLSAAILSSTAARKAADGRASDATTVALTAETADQTARIVVGQHPEASTGRDRYDVVAPPTSFAETALRIRSDASSAPRRQHLVRDLRAPSPDGHSYTVVLTAPAGETVTVSTDLAASRPDAHAVLIQPETGTRYDLRDGQTTLRPATETSTWQLRLGSKAFVQTQGGEEVRTIAVEKPAPNPFRESTAVRYTLPEATDVNVQVFDLLGRRVATLKDERQTSGTHTVRWSGTNASGAPIASGMYFLRMTLGDRRIVHKVVHVR